MKFFVKGVPAKNLPARCIPQVVFIHNRSLARDFFSILPYPTVSTFFTADIKKSNI